MIKISALFVILISIAMYSSLEIAKIDSDMIPSETSRGNLVQLMVNLQTNANPSTISGFVGQLRDMLDKLVKAQATHKRIHAKMMKQCMNEDKFRKAEVAEAKKALAAAGLHRAKCAKSLAAAKKELPSLVSTHSTYVKELRRATKARATEAKRYAARKADYAEALSFLTTFIAYVEKKLKGSLKAFALVEFSENLLKHAAKIGSIQSAVPALVAIAEATYTNAPKANDYEFKANEALGNKLRKVLSELLNRLNTDNKQNNADEKKAITLFNAYRAKLTKVINTLERNIKRTRKQIVEMRQCVDAETKVMKTASKKLSRNATLKSNAQKMCAAFNSEFIDATRNRLDEVKTMQEILKIVAKRFKSLPQDIVAYLETVKDGWLEYTNSTQFKKFVAYKRETAVKNARGKALVTGENVLPDAPADAPADATDDSADDAPADDAPTDDAPADVPAPVVPAPTPASSNNAGN
jgi:vacuolar-type H+-ATPase subunit I/STV1